MKLNSLENLYYNFELSPIKIYIPFGCGCYNFLNKITRILKICARVYLIDKLKTLISIWIE